jgi:transcriptional regulator with XRE-family HTH domain
MPSLGGYIRSLREEFEWTQQQLAAQVGVSVRAVGGWERGETVTPSRRRSLERIFGVPVDDSAGTLFENARLAHESYSTARQRAADARGKLLRAERRLAELGGRTGLGDEYEQATTRVNELSAAAGQATQQASEAETVWHDHADALKAYKKPLITTETDAAQPTDLSHISDDELIDELHRRLRATQSMGH